VAIRNLCDNNLENQSVIQAMHIKSPASTPLLDELGVQLEITEDGKGVRTKRKTTNGGSGKESVEPSPNQPPQD